jgi:hypothetical protein
VEISFRFFIYLVIREALADKEHQLITLMENRLDVQENYYKGKLAEKSADAGVGLKILKQNITVLCATFCSVQRNTSKLLRMQFCSGNNTSKNVCILY